MVQGVDGNWYGYFADRNMAITADATSPGAGVGIDFGTFCDNASGLTVGLLATDLSDTVGIAVPTAAGLEGNAVANPIVNTCGAPAANVPANVVREAKAPSAFPTAVTNSGQIGIDESAWPFIQLYPLNPTGNVVVQYNKGGGVQTTTLTFDSVDDFASAGLDRTVYTPGSQVHATITDLWLNIDPTDEDSWTFGTTGNDNEGAATTNYQVFDENGGNAGDVIGNTDTNLLTAALDDLMCEDNCRLLTNADVNNRQPITGNFVITLSDNDDSALESDLTVTNGAQSPLSFETQGVAFGVIGDGFQVGNVPVTVTEQGPNSGVFSTTDESDQSNIVITNDAARGTSASITYNEDSATILVGLGFGSIDIIPIDDEWNSGEEITIALNDIDANQNSRADEDLDLNNPDVDLIPSLQTGSPVTLDNLGTPTITVGTLTADVEAFSDRARLLTTGVTVTDGDLLTLPFGTMADVFDSTPINEANFNGFALFNYDVRSLANDGNADSLSTVDITLATVPIGTGENLQGLILLDSDTFGGLAAGTALDAVFTLNLNGGPHALADGTDMPVVADIFGFGFSNDGLEAGERIANQLIRLELEETSDNTSTFAGS
jgi:hypothetical protein